jgi:hypothetical protein
MYSVRAFVRLWILSSIVILAYAMVDLTLHPWLRQETHFSMRPDLSRAGELVHWGGRLLKENAHSLLVCNALVLGGLLALVIHGAARLIRRSRDEASQGCDTSPDYALGPRLSEPPPH